MQMIELFSQIRLLKPNLFCIAWSKQQAALGFTWTQKKTEFMCFHQDSVILTKGEPLKLEVSKLP